MKPKKFFPKAILIALFVLILNVGAFSIIYRDNFSSGLSGMAIKKIATDAYEDTSSLSKIFLVVQWLLVLGLLITAMVRDKTILKIGRELSGINLNEISKDSKTDLDTLYKILQNKRTLRLSTITKTFKVKKEVAMDWCKTLESSNLAIIDYPGIGEPVVKIK